MPIFHYEQLDEAMDFDKLENAVKNFDHETVDALLSEKSPFENIRIRDFDDIETWLCDMFEGAYKQDRVKGGELVKVFMKHEGYEHIFLISACEIQDADMVYYILNIPDPTKWMLVDENGREKVVNTLKYGIEEGFEVIKDVEGDIAFEIKEMLTSVAI